MRHQPKSQSSFSNRSKSKRTLPVFSIPKVLKDKAILVSRNQGGIGDMLMLTPTIRAIKEQNPGLKLIVTTSPHYGYKAPLFEILKYNPYIDKVVTVDELINYEFTKIYNFGTGKEISIESDPKHPTGHRIEIFAELADIELKDKSTVYVVSEREKLFAKNWIEKNVPEERREILIGIQVKASASKRSWPEEKSLLLAFKLVNSWKDTSVLFFYDGIIKNKNLSYPNIYYLSGLPIRQVATLIKECDIFIGPDSGLLHLAGALKKRIIGLFGSIVPKSRIEYYENAVGVHLNYFCSPCYYKACDQHFSCITEISVDSVLKLAAKSFGREFKREKILVIRMGGIGDLIQLSSSLKALKEENKKRDIYLATLDN